VAERPLSKAVEIRHLPNLRRERRNRWQPDRLNLCFGRDTRWSCRGSPSSSSRGKDDGGSWRYQTMLRPVSRGSRKANSHVVPPRVVCQAARCQLRP